MTDTDTPAQIGAAELDEEAQIHADMAWWKAAGQVVGLELCGWTFRSSAQFVDEKGQTILLPGTVGERLIALSAPRIREEALREAAALAEASAAAFKLAGDGGDLGLLQS